jgi:hypothetical protein
MAKPPSKETKKHKPGLLLNTFDSASWVAGQILSPVPDFLFEKRKKKMKDANKGKKK